MIILLTAFPQLNLNTIIFPQNAFDTYRKPAAKSCLLKQSLDSTFTLVELPGALSVTANIRAHVVLMENVTSFVQDIIN